MLIELGAAAEEIENIGRTYSLAVSVVNATYFYEVRLKCGPAQTSNTGSSGAPPSYLGHPPPLVT